MRLSNHILPLFLSIITTFLLFSCSEFSDKKTKVKEKEEYQVPVEITELVLQDISNTYRTTAVLEARAESKVTNKVTGMINKILVEEGMLVAKGQVLAEIDDESYQLDYERASIDLASASAEFRRSQPIDGKQLIAAKDLEKLEFQVKTRINQQAVAAIQVRDAKVRSPIAGVIAKRMVKEGNMIANTGSEMFHVVALDTLQGVVYLPESEMMNVHIGQHAKLFFPANKRASVPATVALISPLIDTESGTFKVTLKVNNDNSVLKPGMFAKVSLVLDIHENAQIVPQKSLLVTDTETSLYVVANKKAKRVVVETGYEQDGLVEILTPLSEDEPIVVVGQQGLKVDSLVKVLNEEKQIVEKQRLEKQKTDNHGMEVKSEKEQSKEETS